MENPMLRIIVAVENYVKALEMLSKTIEAATIKHIALIKQRENTNDKYNLINKGITYFKDKYSKSPFMYPGKNMYVNLFIDCIKIGLSIKEAYEISIKIIDYEFNQLYDAFARNYNYTECYNIKHPILTHIVQSFSIAGLSAAKAGKALAEACKPIAELPKEHKSKFKAWVINTINNNK